MIYLGLVGLFKKKENIYLKDWNKYYFFYMVFRFYLCILILSLLCIGMGIFIFIILFDVLNNFVM